jgi:cytochrome c oxidase accessory protein FixG
LSVNDRLGMLDEFGGRQRIIPAEVKGYYRTWRTRIHGILLVILLILPWLRINGMQAVLIDLPGRRFEIFGLVFLSHDAPLLFFIVMLFVLGLVLMTALWGRVWCGWACPQTVFVDSVFRRIEIWTEGEYVKRRRLAAGPLTFEKFMRTGSKWILFTIASSIIAHSVMAYFAGSRKLIAMMQGDPSQNWGYFVCATFITSLILFDFGWFREQFCVIMCPYGRFQAALMDKQTVTVMYDEKRGEPRRSLAPQGKRGDCISCNRCVEVCPTKIDIREGIQMECIACTACIDACDEMMAKVHKPPNLIGYRKISDEPKSFRPRIAVYSAFALVLILGLIWSLWSRRDFSFEVLRATDAPYQMIQDGRILNHFRAHYMNQSTKPQEVEIVLSSEAVEAGFALVEQSGRKTVQSGGSIEPHLFVSFPKALLNSQGEAEFELLMIDSKSGRETRVNVKAVGPYSSGS